MGICSSTKEKYSHAFLRFYKIEKTLFVSDHGLIIRAVNGRDLSFCTIDKKQKAYLAFLHLNNIAFNQLNTLRDLQHPSILKLNYALQDAHNVYLILDEVRSRLSYYLKKGKRFTEEETKYILASIITSLEYLRSKNIIHRNINPFNIMFDDAGHVKLYGFEYAKLNNGQSNNEKTLSIGNQLYTAPEILKEYIEGFEADLFSLGATLYEMITLKIPIMCKRIKGEIKINQVTLKKNDIPDEWSENTMSFVNGLLKILPDQRLGSRSIDELKNHPWFKGYDWDAQTKGNNPPIFIPLESDVEEEASEPGIESQFQIPKKQSKAAIDKLFIGYEYGIPKDIIHKQDLI